MKKLFALLVCLVFLGVASATDGRDKTRTEVPSIFEFNRLTAVVPPFTGPANPIRGIGGGGAAWKIRFRNCGVNATGELEVSVRRPVLGETGANPIAPFAVLHNSPSKDAPGPPPW